MGTASSGSEVYNIQIRTLKLAVGKRNGSDRVVELIVVDREEILKCGIPCRQDPSRICEV
jgi:hypothetical protein